MKRILIFSTYPIKSPSHGGQKRVEAICKSYQEAGLDVTFVAIFFPLHYKEYSRTDIKIPKKYLTTMSENPFTGDVITGEIIRDDTKLAANIKKLIHKIRPDIIQIEHPFLYIGLEPIIRGLKKRPKIVFSSHNTEFKMKEEMLQKEGYPKEQIELVKEKIYQVEKSIAVDADLIIVVSPSDKDDLTKMGVPSNKIHIARNGINRTTFSPKDLKYWEEYFQKQSVNKIAVFIGSAHPPNWTGFNQLIGSRVGLLNKDQRIVLAGGISDYFTKYYSSSNPESVIFWKRVLAVGKLSEARLSALINRADCILLPITEGGGSNLKTAEALLADKPIVCTEYALRSFEEFRSNPNISIATSSDDFVEKISQVLSKPLQKNKEALKSKDLEVLRWAESLKAISKEVSRL